MKEDRNIRLDIDNSATMKEYIAYLERKDEEKKRARRDFWYSFGTALSYIFMGAGITTVTALAVIGLAVIL